MKKACSYILIFLMFVSVLMYPKFEAQAANVSIGVSASTVNIGDTVKVTVSVPDGITATVNLSFSANILSFTNASVEVGASGGNITINLGKLSMANSNSVTLNFKANTSGAANVNATVISAVDNNTVEDVALDGAATTVTVENQTAPPANNGGGNDGPEKSSDNSLSSIKLSSGTLSPGFKYNVTKYTATVGYDVSEIVVSANTSHEKAVIESVTGDGKVKLDVGENTIKIVVKAENGVKATYTIVVTRKAQGETEPTEGESQTTPPEVNQVLQWNGEQLTPVKEIPADKIPTEFESTLLVVNGYQMQGLSFSKGDLKVLYLNNTNEAGSLYVYDEVQQTVYPFIKIDSEKSYVMVLLPDEQNAPAPEGFESCTFSIEGKGIVQAYQLKDKSEGVETEEDSTMSWNLFGAETFYAAEPKLEDFYLIYCMNNSGEKGWYMYDSVEGTVQRYIDLAPSAPVGGGVSGDESNDISLDNKYEALQKELNTAKMTQYIIIAIAAVIVIILVVVIIVLVLKNRNKDEDFFDGYEDDEDDEDEEDTDGDADDADNSEEVEEETTEDGAVVEESEDALMVDTMTEESEDEIEIEFYEMEPDSDDEIEIEFYNMEDLIVSETEEAEKKVPETPVVRETPVVKEIPVVEEVSSVKKEEEPEIKIQRKPKVVDPTSKITGKKEDDDDLEFIDFE